MYAIRSYYVPAEVAPSPSSWPKTSIPVGTIIHLEQRKLTAWRGNYDSFERQYREARELQDKARAKQAAQRKHMEAFVNRFRAKASKARQVV